MPVHDFTTDLADGLRLIALCEVLSGTKFPRYVKNPRFPFQKMANITEALDFMSKHFGIRFVGLNAQGMLLSEPKNGLRQQLAHRASSPHLSVSLFSLHVPYLSGHLPISPSIVCVLITFLFRIAVACLVWSHFPSSCVGVSFRLFLALILLFC